ncbi:MAG: TRAP transporter small permease [Deltaproteobacteria bacterium]|nr:TRAP transporter small permease [Deltaproteobacteria bacterium]
MLGKRLYAGFDLSLNAIIIAIFSIMLIVVGLNVLCRYLLNFSLGWADESARLLFILMVFIGSIGAHKDKAHFSFDIFVKKLPPQLYIAAKLVAHSIVIYVLISMLVGGIKTFILLTNKTPALGIPVKYIYLAIPLSMLAMLVMTVHTAIYSIVKCRNQLK